MSARVYRGRRSPCASLQPGCIATARSRSPRRRGWSRHGRRPGRRRLGRTRRPRIVTRARHPAWTIFTGRRLRSEDRTAESGKLAVFGLLQPAVIQVRFPLDMRAGVCQGVCVDFDSDRVWQAIEACDPRFDGWVFCGVKTTGIYCRPSCPARTPKRENVRLFGSAAAAQSAGFRACKRCRPDATPGSPEWDLRADLVGRAMRLIADGVVDRAGVSGLARRLGYTERHVHRQLVAVVGAGPLALARAQRAQTARILLETTAVSITAVAFAAGFQSVRQFNATVREVFAMAPRELRARARRGDHSQQESGALSL